MGVRTLFSWGEGKNLLFDEKQNKKILFFSKSLKTYYFWPVRGVEGVRAPLDPPPETHGIKISFPKNFLRICLYF
jgi:hypothetical protein